MIGSNKLEWKENKRPRSLQILTILKGNKYC